MAALKQRSLAGTVGAVLGAAAVVVLEHYQVAAMVCGGGF